jgi:RES domain-containing protein
MSSSIEIRDRIRWLNRIDISNTDFDLLFKKVGKLTTGFTAAGEWCVSSESLFRARVNPKCRPTTLTELMAPPPRFVLGYQRCNPPGLPMFYAASRRMTALLECDASRGDIIYLSQWAVANDAPMNAAIHPLMEHKLPQTPLQLYVQSYMETIFTRRVDKSFSDDYKLTAALSQHLTTGFLPDPLSGVREDRTVGLRYPSIVDIENSYNTVFHDQFSKDRLRPLHVMEMRILNVEGKKISYDVLDNAIDFSNGEICWMNDPNKVPALQIGKTGLPYRSYGGGVWRILTSENEPTIEYLAALLSEF